jgi:hypothetical protein
MCCMAITTHTMVVELSHEIVISFMRWLFRELFLSPCSLLHIIKNPMWHCTERSMGLMTCTNVLALRPDLV